MLTPVGTLLAAKSSFPLFLEATPASVTAAASMSGSGWVLTENASYDSLPDCRREAGCVIKLLATNGACECAYDVRATGDGFGSFAAPAPLSHGPKKLPRTIQISAERVLLRIQAPERAMPGLNWAIGLDGLRVLEAAEMPPLPSSEKAAIDWLISVDAEDCEDVVDRCECGVRGEDFRLRGASSSSDNSELLRIEQIASGTTLVLPEACRVAAATDGVLPDDVEVCWRVTPTARRQPTPMERCVDGAANRPYWLTAGSAADARLLAYSLPPKAAWAAHLRRRALPTPEEIASLRAAGCGGLALAWSEELAAALEDGAWAAAAGVDLHVSSGAGRAPAAADSLPP